MKNILLLGNGFDLYYQLPTKYANFLNVTNYLLKSRDTTSETVGDIFGKATLQKTDSFIAKCYNDHKKEFDETTLDKDAIHEIVKLTEKNLWFLYFSKVFNKDVGWIDFEKEIGFVLKCFGNVFDKGTTLVFKHNEQYVKFVIDTFGFLIDEAASRNSITIGAYKANSNYCIEHPLGSGKTTINKDQVVEKLYSELSNLARALKLYLKCFVENVCDVIKNNDAFQRIEFLSHIEKAITFNYTNIYEEFYFNNSVFHIHGNTNSEIVLGINPNEDDQLESIDTTFVCFKKYYQRTLFETDTNYLRWIGECTNEKTAYRLFTMGHSLDITDKDIISELFLNAKEIVVLYHDLEAKKSYITNLVNIFGKDYFDLLKKDKKLKFLCLNQDLSAIKTTLSEESWQDIQEALREDEVEKLISI